MQKVINVHKIVFFILLLVIQTSVFSQKKLDGTYGYLDGTGEFWIQLEFSKDNIFSYKSGMDVGISEYGTGHYTLTKDSLILNYDLTDIRIAGYHIAKPYINRQDTVQIKIKVFDFDKKVLENVQVIISGTTISNRFLAEGITDEKGEILLSYKKKQENSILQFIYDYSIYSFELWGNSCYELEVYLSKISDYLRGNAIKGTIQKYKIIKMKKDVFELQQPNGSKLKFERNPPDVYNPFE